MKRGQLVKLLLDEEAHCFLANNEFYIIVVTTLHKLAPLFLR